MSGAMIAGGAPLSDLGAAADVVVRVFQELAARKPDLADAGALGNSVQQILVDVGVEPLPVFEASKLAQSVATALLGAYSAGMVAGGQPRVIEEESSANFKDR